MVGMLFASPECQATIAPRSAHVRIDTKARQLRFDLEAAERAIALAVPYLQPPVRVTAPSSLEPTPVLCFVLRNSLSLSSAGVHGERAAVAPRVRAQRRPLVALQPDLFAWRCLQAVPGFALVLLRRGFDQRQALAVREGRRRSDEAHTVDAATMRFTRTTQTRGADEWLRGTA